MAEVQFFSENTSFKLKNKRRTIDWLKLICRKEKRSLNSLSYIFCTDSFLGRLNKEYLKHTSLTDILTFDFSEDRKINGEIYISIPRVKANARLFKQPFEVELRRVIAHGILHLIGYDDSTKSQKARMRLKEEACLSLWK